MSRTNIEKAIVIRMLRDPSFKQKLLKNPKEVVKEFCKEDPNMKNIDFSQLQVRVEHEKKNELILVIPYIDENATLSDRDLEKLAAGGTTVTVGHSLVNCQSGGGFKWPF